MNPSILVAIFAAAVATASAVPADAGIVGTRGWLGVSDCRIPDEPHTAIVTGDGALLAHVDATGPAARAGLVDGDVVLAVDGAAVRSFAELAAHLATRQLGDVVTLQARRADVEMSVRVELARWPDASAALAPLLVESRAVLAGSTNAFGLAGAARPAASPWVLSAGAPPGPR